MMKEWQVVVPPWEASVPGALFSCDEFRAAFGNIFEEGLASRKGVWFPEEKGTHARKAPTRTHACTTHTRSDWRDLCLSALSWPCADILSNAHAHAQTHTHTHTRLRAPTQCCAATLRDF